MNSAIGELSFASALWGFGFVASAWALQSLGFISLTLVRFVISLFCAGAWALLIGARRDLFNRQQFWLAFWPGILLSLTLLIQTWGLSYTTPTRSGFITCLYILTVPVLESFFLKKQLSPWHFIFVIVALVGTAMICDLNADGSGWNKGDVITLLCTVTASAQILYFAVIAKRIGSAVAFNALQSAWAILPLVVLVPFFENPMHATFTTRSMSGVLFLGIGSSTLAFMLQVKAQKTISASMASMLCLLESPFAMLFSILFTGEVLKPLQWIGAIFVLVSVGFSTQIDARTKRRAGGRANVNHPPSRRIR